MRRPKWWEWLILAALLALSAYSGHCFVCDVLPLFVGN